LLIPVLARALEEQRSGSLTGQEQVDDTHGGVGEALTEAHADYLHPKPRGLIQDVLKIMLKNLTLLGNHDSPDIVYPILDVSLVKEILLECGETEINQDAELLREMVEIARSPAGRLDVEAFANALTCDLDKWQAGNEDRLSTIFYDVFEETRASVNERSSTADASDTDQNPPEKGHFNKENSIDHSNVDYVVDTHASVICVVIIWIFYLFISVTYASLFQAAVKLPCEDTTNSKSFGCMLAIQLWNW
jgi:hypothetical protein